MKLITPQEARELSLSGHKIKCQLTRQAETDFINFLNRNLIPHSYLSNFLHMIEFGKASFRLFESDPHVQLFSIKNSEPAFYSISDDMFLFFAIDL